MTLIIAIFIILGVIGNLVTIVTIQSTSKLQTVSNYLLVSICVSDMVSVLLCAPLWLLRSFWNITDWKIGEFMCELVYFKDFIRAMCIKLKYKIQY